MNKEYNDQIEGRNAVLEYLESGKDIDKILITKGEKHGSIKKIIAIAKEMKLPVKLVGVGEKMEDLKAFNPDDFIEALFS